MEADEEGCVMVAVIVNARAGCDQASLCSVEGWHISKLTAVGDCERFLPAMECLDLAPYYRRFIAKLLVVANPLFALTKKDAGHQSVTMHFGSSKGSSQKNQYWLFRNLSMSSSWTHVLLVWN